MEYIHPARATKDERAELALDMADVEGPPPFPANGHPYYEIEFFKKILVGNSFEQAFTIAGLTDARLAQVIAARCYASEPIRRIYRRKSWHLKPELVWSAPSARGYGKTG
jgi:hypothetical protein